MSETIRVLHVDDEPEFASLAAEFLEREDDRFAVETATSASEGLDRLTDDVDCIVSDYDMPGTNGIEFLETVREAYSDLPFILFTGKGSEEVASEAISAGVTDYLQKGGDTSQYTVLANRIENSVDQYRAEQEAERTQRRLRELTESVPDCLWMFDRDWEELLFVSGYEKVLGRPVEAIEADPQDFLNAVPSDDRGRVRAAMDRLSSGESIDVEYPILRGEETGWVWVRGEPVFDDAGEVARVVGFTRDVTERKERERELKRYERLVESLPIPVFLTGPDGKIFDVNSAFAEQFGAESVAEMRDRDATELWVDAEDRDALVERVEREGTVQQELARMQTLDGEKRWMEVTMTLVEDRYLEGICHDVTDRKRRERALERLHESTRDLLRAETDREIAETIVGAVGEALGFPINLVRFVDDESRELRPVARSAEVESVLGDRPVYSVGEGTAGRAFQRGETLVYDDTRDLDDGYDRGDARASMYVPIGDHGVLSVGDTEAGTFDPSDVRLAEIFAANAAAVLNRLEESRARKQQNERLKEFTSIVSHDLQNPLNVAEGRLELARGECDSSHLDDVAAAHDRMRTLIEDLLELARQGERVAELGPVELASAVESRWDAVEAPEATLRVETDLTIEADEDRLGQFLSNLFRNALDHGGADVTVTVGDIPDGFYVADDGPGIPESERDRVFESGYSTSEEGTGFGLAIVEGIADAHGWDVSVTESESGGARFEIAGVEVAGGRG